MDARKYALIGPDWYCDGTLTMTEQTALHFSMTEPDKFLVPVSDDEYEVLRQMGTACRYQDGQWNVVNDEDLLELKDRARGISVTSARRARQERLVVRDALSGILSGLPELLTPPAVSITTPAKNFAFTPVSLPNGITINLATVGQCSAIAQGMLDSGVYEGEHFINAADRWRADPASWLLVFEWAGNVIQVEHLRLEGDTVEFGFTQHVMKERPYWFWRALEQPVLDQLAAHGITKGFSLVRSDATEYIKALKATYIVTDMGRQADSSHLRLEYLLGDTPVAFKTPRTAGPAWSWTSGNGAVQVTETTDVAAARALVAASWGTANRKAEILRMFDERVGLDSATILIGKEAPGQPAIPPVVYVVRERTPTISSSSDLMPWSTVTEHGRIANGVMAWHAAVGYETLTTFYVPERINQPMGRKRMRILGATFGHEKVYGGLKWVEVVADVDVALARTVGSWQG